MANVKISQAADVGTLLSSDMLPLARSGDTNAYRASMAEISAFTTASVASGAYGNVGRNLLHNALFNVQQRGAGPFTTNGLYTLDRWQGLVTGDTMSLVPFGQTDADRAAIGDEASIYCLRNVFTGAATAANYTAIQQPIEALRRLAGKTVTVSFWATAASGTPKLGVNVLQYFGTGGSPSATVQVAGQAVTLSTTWQRFSLTFSVPSAVGKTLGTNGDDATNLRFWYSSGATNNVNAGSVGVQSGTIFIWGVQLEIGSTATPLEKLDPRNDLANCQRFYSVLPNVVMVAAYSGGAFGGGIACLTYPVTMRAPPSVGAAIVGGNATTGLAVVSAQYDNVTMQFASAASQGQWYSFNLFASADL